MSWHFSVTREGPRSPTNPRDLGEKARASRLSLPCPGVPPALQSSASLSPCRLGRTLPPPQLLAVGTKHSGHPQGLPPSTIPKRSSPKVSEARTTVLVLGPSDLVPCHLQGSEVAEDTPEPCSPGRARGKSSPGSAQVRLDGFPRVGRGGRVASASYPLVGDRESPGQLGGCASGSRAERSEDDWRRRGR